MIYKKTVKGQQVLKDRSVMLSPKQRVAFILLDGQTPVHEILNTLSSMELTQEDIDRLIQDGLVEPAGHYGYEHSTVTVSNHSANI